MYRIGQEVLIKPPGGKKKEFWTVIYIYPENSAPGEDVQVLLKRSSEIAKEKRT